MIPAIFPSREVSGAVIGIAGAVGPLGGAAVNPAFRQSFLTHGTGVPAYVAFIASFVICMAATWAVYLRPRLRESRLPCLPNCS